MEEIEKIVNLLEEYRGDVLSSSVIREIARKVMEVKHGETL